jgi:O-antigen/teichoic acid export membrane protein
MLKNIIKNSLITSLPSIVSLFLSLFCVPVFLREIGIQNYGEYIFIHLLTSLGLILNLGVGKLLIANSINKQIDFFYNAIIVTLFISVFFFLILYTILLFTNLLNHKTIFIILGVCLTILYYTLESNLILKKKFKFLSILNFSFFAFSLNIPIILKIIFKFDVTLNQLILISLSVKFFILLIFLIHQIFETRNLKFINFKEYLKNLKYGIWYSSSNVLLLSYAYLDKYFIKFYLNSSALAIYSIPQQICGKINILSKAISTVFLPEIKLKKSHASYNKTINIYFFIFFPILLISFNFFDELLIFWLKENYHLKIYTLTKIFALAYFFNSFSEIIITEFEATKKIDKIAKIEAFIFPIFLIILFLIFTKFRNENTIFNVACFILLKEFIFTNIKIFYSSFLKQKYLKLLYATLIFIIGSLSINYIK